MKITTGKVRLSYANVWEPKPYKNQPPKYSCSLIIPKSDTKTVNKIREAIREMLADQDIINKLGGKTKNIRTPLRDGDVDREEDAAYANSFFINASADENHPPRIVDRDKNEILDRSEVYSGCYVQVVLNLFPYNQEGNRGIGCGLAGIRKLADGEPLSGTVVSDDDFDDDFDGADDDIY